MSHILVAVSGGIDSLVTARILQEEGHKIRAVHFLTGFQKKKPEKDMEELGKRLGCRIEIVDFSKDFQNHVIDNFVEEYRAGRTPNPCLICNPAIKFGSLMSVAEKMDCMAVATGHYARILPTEDGLAGLFRGRDKIKDQSYFLSRVPRYRLDNILFPLGSFTKEEVRQKAHIFKLEPLSEKESQDICFLPDGGYADFLETTGNIKPLPGPIVTTDGKVIGRHRGLHRYTIGQRRGLDCPGPAPYHVLALDTAHNHLVVGFREEMMASGCCVNNINWLMPLPSAALQITVKIRYRHQDVPATLIPEGNSRASVHFTAPQAAITPGQGAVFYHKDRVLGGGFIQEKI
ncbi:tRNA 2-thiouridine(34) synthase MnmA [Desulfobotulus mexicanus]|uniref:tRNA-specific 2-thiouridylase MnmA n=1 Tax=Desulfobotulus mexicanus TaxID=2586642 RepID=A0A5Q4VGT2_9BACT|nr:tRNA 2-thiouridine(34) synthase MnmA [Desulfobotulus mexicanus]TYT75577.1 tRNA 2-thiouridine(34) synthase MnmA [Desulfobotulus mexicanus]